MFIVYYKTHLTFRPTRVLPFSRFTLILLPHSIVNCSNFYLVYKLRIKQSQVQKNKYIQITYFLLHHYHHPPYHHCKSCNLVKMRNWNGNKLISKQAKHNNKSTAFVKITFFSCLQSINFPKNIDTWHRLRTVCTKIRNLSPLTI